MQKIAEQATPTHKKKIIQKNKSDINEVSYNRLSELFNDELFVMKQFWEALGATENFKKLFMKVSSEMDIAHVKTFFDLEIKHLKTLSDSIAVKI